MIDFRPFFKNQQLRDFLWFSAVEAREEIERFPIVSTEMSYFLPIISMAQNKQLLACIVLRQEGSYFTEIIRNCYLQSWHLETSESLYYPGIQVSPPPQSVD
jgi:hypothetical protein